MKHVFFAAAMNDDGIYHPLSQDNLSEEIQNKGLAWVHLDMNHPDTKPWLESELSYLDPFIIDALLADETRPRITEINGGALIILRGVNMNANADPSDMISIRLWIDKHRIISIQRRQLQAILDIQSDIREHNPPKNAGDFLCLLMSRLLFHMGDIITKIDNETDKIETKILKKPDKSLRKHIVDIRSKAISLRRYIAPQRDVLIHIFGTNLGWIKQSHQRALHESYDIITRHLEDLESVRERSILVKDELSNMLNEKLNKNMYVLSVISAIFLPLTFLTGLLGINVAGIPGAENANAFGVFCSLLFGLVVIQYFIFKKLKWFL